jgi:hypothetical protein
MNKLIYLIIIFISNICWAQIKGNLTDNKTGLPIEFANVWVKNTMIGTTTDLNGDFELEKQKVGDTLLISYLGYKKIEFLAQTINIIKLDPEETQLDEIIITQTKNTQKHSINSFKDYKDINMFYLNGHYSFARYYKFKEEYKKNTFIKKASLVTSASLDKVKFRVHLIEADMNGSPTNKLLGEYIILEVNNGQNEVTIDFSDKQITIPENGFFIVVDRLNLRQNITSYDGKTDVLEPGIGMEKKSREKNTWLSYGGKWITPNELKRFAGKNKNIAINLELSN